VDRSVPAQQSRGAAPDPPGTQCGGRGIDDAGMTAEPEVVVGAEVEHGFDGRAGHGQTASQAEPVLALEFPASTLARIGFHHPASNRLGHAGEGRRPGSCLPHCEVVGILNGTDPMGTARIVGLGHATPRRIVSSAEIERELGLESGWIERRTGVRTRRVCAPEESCSTLAVDAARRALDHCRIAPADIGLVLLATSTPDYLLPPTAPAVAERLGCRRAGAVDLAGACAGFLYALILAAAQVEVSGRAALVIAANVLSRRLDPIDPSSRALFADGAGAVVVSNESTLVDPFARLEASVWGSDGAQADAIRIEAGGSARPIDLDAVEEGLHYLRIENGSRLFVAAVEGLARVGAAALDDVGLTSSDVDLWVPHQANARILERAGGRLGIDRSRCFSILEEWGNSSAASLPTALSLASEGGLIPKGKNVLLTAVGAGLVEAGVVLRT
jgi:3-oxoacyl-[acyl-carrier-protein] synthase III